MAENTYLPYCCRQAAEGSFHSIEAMDWTWEEDRKRMTVSLYTFLPGLVNSHVQQLLCVDGLSPKRLRKLTSIVRRLDKVVQDLDDLVDDAVVEAYGVLRGQDLPRTKGPAQQLAADEAAGEMMSDTSDPQT